MSTNSKLLEELREKYLPVKDEIQERLHEFTEVWVIGDPERIFAELIFCLMTPQSRAESCWNAVERLVENDLIRKGPASTIACQMKGVRFHNQKANNIVLVRRQFIKNNRNILYEKLSQFNDNLKLREWLVNNVKGLGYKEASHFLRNIGQGKNLTILDRHILKNLLRYGVIQEIPGTMTRKRYLKIEQLMIGFSAEADIPVEHLDLLFWYNQTGKVFK